MHRNASMVNADFHTGMREPDHGIASCAAKLVKHRCQTRGRWRRQTLTTQEPTQQVARTMRGKRVKCFAPQRDSLQCAVGVLLCQFIEQACGFGLMRGHAGQSCVRLRHYVISALLSSSIQVSFLSRA